MLADEADSVRVVDHHQRIVFLRQIAYLVEPRQIAVHGKYAIRRDQPMPRIACLPQLLFQVLHVAIAITESHGFGQPHSVDDAGVIQRIADDGILFVEQRFEQTAVCVEAR
jgi:hypothetical protein